MEHFVSNKLFFLQINNLVSRKMILLLPKSQLLHILHDWTEALESGGRIDVIYTDFEKAFDKVPHT